MQNSLKVLETDISKTVEAAQNQFAAGVENSNDNVKRVFGP